MPNDSLSHPEHDAVAQELRRWYTSSAPEIDLVVHERWFGFLNERRGTVACRVVLAVDDAADVARAIDDARTLAGPGPLQVWIEDRRRDELIRDALEHCGAINSQSIVTLALVGPYLGDAGPEGLSITPVSPNGFEIYAALKLQSFNDDETLPPIDEITAEAKARAAESPLADYFIAWLEGLPVAIQGLYRGVDQMTFHLATRVPYRHLGIAQAMLGHWVRRGNERRCRSFMINCRESGRPAELYRRLGFVDEVNWSRHYDLR